MKTLSGICGVFFYLVFSCAQAEGFKYFEAEVYPGKTAGWESKDFIVKAEPRCLIDEGVLATIKCVEPALAIESKNKEIIIEDASISGSPIFVRNETIIGNEYIYSNIGVDALNYLSTGRSFDVVIKFRSPRKSNNPKYLDRRVPFEGIMYLDEASIPLLSNDIEVKKVISANKLSLQERANKRNNELLMMYGILGIVLIAIYHIMKYAKNKGRQVADSAINKTIEINDKIVAHNEKVRIKERSKDENERV